MRRVARRRGWHTGRMKEIAMSKQAPAALARPLKLYATGHAALLVGAWAMHATGSMLPMALTAIS